MANKRETGRRYEELAAAYLEEKGYGIRESNYRNRSGEIDLLAEKEGRIIACEVKYRSTERCGDPAEAVDMRKQRKISRTLMCYLVQHGYPADTPCRFDVIAVYGDGTVHHIKNAFEFRT